MARDLIRPQITASLHRPVKANPAVIVNTIWGASLIPFFD
jgi:hypothetical protein